ncbi:MAG: hypothetical protein GF353_21460 [Candidatus Lokiarchaeota archaeon]|nr:hypothetical protein [Candidatus Lokiarchaeota archaeon]
MGLTDSYSKNYEFVTFKELMRIEQKCVKWRYRIKENTDRLCQVHGDFHPWNILFKEGIEFRVLDRSRGEWGEPADDVTSMTMNYLFYSLLAHNNIEGAFLELFNLFWESYLTETQDYEILSMVAPFYAWRCLVLASPIWYPELNQSIRKKLFNFIHNVLAEEKFDLKKVPGMFE